MSEIICISSEDESVIVQNSRTKRRKISKKYKNPKSVIILKDSDDESEIKKEDTPTSECETMELNINNNEFNSSILSIVEITTLSEEDEMLCKKETESDKKQNQIDNSLMINNTNEIVEQKSTNTIKEQVSNLEEKDNLISNNDTINITKTNSEINVDNVIPNNTESQSVENPDSNQDEKTNEEGDFILENESFRNFLNASMSEKVSKHDRIIIEKCFVKIRKRYQATKKAYLDSLEFKNLLEDRINAIEKNPRTVIIHFKDVFLELKRNKNEMICSDKEDVKKKKIIKNLQKILRKLEKRIKRLEQEELSVENDWDNDSIYIQTDRYKKRFNNVYQKLCQYTGESKFVGRLTYTKLNYQRSKVKDINDAINSFYEKKNQFPNFADIDKCIRDCVAEKKLNLTTDEITSEIKEAFKNIGKILKKRRHYELKESLECFNEENLEDPACQNDELNEKLKSNKIVNDKKLAEVFELYVKKQEQGEDYISDNSYDSNE